MFSFLETEHASSGGEKRGKKGKGGEGERERRREREREREERERILIRLHAQHRAQCGLNPMTLGS